jgi:multicomponent Na+:H+ antiporter subunit B
MPSMILSTATRYLLPLLLLFSVFLLLRGHNEPGGGFVGGLSAAAAFALYAITFGVRPTRRMVWLQPRTLIGLGLLTAVSSGLIAVFTGRPFLTGIWASVSIPPVGKLGTPLLFDVGVYLVVVGMVLMIVFELAED